MIWRWGGGGGAQAKKPSALRSSIAEMFHWCLAWFCFFFTEHAFQCDDLAMIDCSVHYMMQKTSSDIGTIPMTDVVVGHVEKSNDSSPTWAMTSHCRLPQSDSPPSFYDAYDITI